MMVIFVVIFTKIVCCKEKENVTLFIKGGIYLTSHL